MDAKREKEMQNVKFAVFGLGSSRTHETLYNVVGKTLDKRYVMMGSIIMVLIFCQPVALFIVVLF